MNLISYVIITQIDEFQKLWQKSVNFVYTNNIGALKSVVKRNLHMYKSNNIRDKINYLRLKNLLGEVDKNYQLTYFECKLVTDYLAESKIWTVKELSIFISFMNCFNPDLLEHITNKTYNKGSIFLTIKENKHVLVQALLNANSILIQEERIETVMKYHGYIERLIDENDLFEKNIFLFATGTIEVVNGQIFKGKAKMLKSIEILQDLGSHQLADNFQSKFDEILKFYETSNNSETPKFR